MKMKCIVVSGLGEGAYFMSLDHYKNEINEKLEFNPFPGTLNLKSDDFTKDLLKDKQPIRIEGFEKEGKKFGGATCYKATLGGVKGALIFPDINKHQDQVEFISDKKIRDEFQLEDNHTVEVIIE